MHLYAFVQAVENRITLWRIPAHGLTLWRQPKEHESDSHLRISSLFCVPEDSSSLQGVQIFSAPLRSVARKEQAISVPGGDAPTVII